MRLMFIYWFFSALISASVYSDEIDNNSIYYPMNIHDRKITTASSDTIFACPTLNSRYPHKKDCALFYECRFGYPHLMKCEKYKIYDDIRQQCREKCSVDCNRRDQNRKELDNDASFKCPYVWGTFAHPALCSKYYVCVQNVPTLFQCYGSTLFDTRDRKCLERNRVNCENRLDREDFTATESSSASTPNTATFPVTASNSTISLITTNEENTSTSSTSKTKNTPTPISTTILRSSSTPPALTSAATETITESEDIRNASTTTSEPLTEPPTTNLKLSSSTLKIMKPNTPPPTDCDGDDLDCILDKTGDITDWFECPENGLFPHGGSPQLFIHCDSEKPFVQKCGEGTYFSPEYKVCMITLIPTAAETLMTTILLTASTEKTITESPTTNPTMFSSTLKMIKPNTPPPTDCDGGDLDCILDKTGDVTDWFECPENGIFPHGGSQQLFIHCDNEKPFVQKCGEGTHFSPEYKVCTWIEKQDEENF